MKRKTNILLRLLIVPSVNGISHSPEDMANGASVLFKTVLEIDGGALE